MVKKLYCIGGMHCPNCAMRIESIEDTLPGIRRAEASYKKGNLSVEFDETVIGEAEIFAAIKKMGYSPQVE